MTDSPPIPSQIKQLIDSSGNSFHARVAQWFQTNGWLVRVSPYYMDQTQSKAREIDLVAERTWPIHDFANRFRGDVVARLFIECKFVAASTVFWMANKDVAAAEGLVYSTRPFERNNIYSKKHHYIANSPRVAKVFASEQGRGPELEWMYKALNQVLNARVSMGAQQPLSPNLKRNRGVCVVLDFPVIVCSSFERLYRADFFGSDPTSNLRENFQLEIQYAFADRNGNDRDDYFLVDIVEYNQLESFATAIEEDASVAVFMAAD